VRVYVRLKHSLAEGEEIHTVLPDTLAEIEALAAEAGWTCIGHLNGEAILNTRRSRRT